MVQWKYAYPSIVWGKGCRIFWGTQESWLPKKGEIEIDGLSGKYTFSAWSDQEGNSIYIRYGGGMPTLVGLQKTASDYVRGLLLR